MPDNPNVIVFLPDAVDQARDDSDSESNNGNNNINICDNNNCFHFSHIQWEDYKWLSIIAALILIIIELYL